ncbi:hypothetical protein BGZ73_009223 [Actinomortierella ambigua]|nr:hypothetical protein BGZ73_009223 [Actinomortierella ambigua]
MYLKAGWKDIKVPESISKQVRSTIDDFQEGLSFMADPENINAMAARAKEGLQASWDVITDPERLHSMTNPTMETLASTWHAVNIPERVADISLPNMEDIRSGWQDAAKIPENLADIPHPTMEDVKSGWDTIPNSVKGAAVGLAALQVTVMAVGALGFGPAGIVAGSKAAAIMASYSGTVTSGSLCALAQSIGASGVSATAYGFAGSLGGLVGASIPSNNENGHAESTANSPEAE